MRIIPVNAKISIVSFTPTSKILPKRKLKISTVNPSESPMITRPTAIPDDKRTATDASPEMLYLSLIRVMINALTNDTPYAVQRG